MIRLLHMTDTHIQGQTPAFRTDDFPQTLLNKLVEIGEIAREYDVDAILHTGDILERPDTGSGIVGDLVEILLNYEKPIVGIVGNHDSWGQNPKSIRSTVLNIVHKAKVIDLIGPGEKRFIEKDGICLRITGQPFHYEIDRRDPMLDYYVDKHDCDIAVHMVHGMLVDRPFPWGPYTLLNQVKTEADIILCGHYHPGFEHVYHLNGTYFCNPGSIARTKVSDVDRHPRVALIEIDSSGIRFQFIPLKSAREGSQVFNMEEVARAKERQERTRGWTEKIRDIDDYRVVNPLGIVDRISEETRVAPKVVEQAKQRISETAEKLGLSMEGLNTSTSVPRKIVRIELYNFQAHTASVFELHPGLNVFCGPTNSGKSSIVRALGWMFENRWADIYMRSGAKETRVVLVYDDGYKVDKVRNRTGSINRYIVTDPTGQTTEYDKFGSRIPPEVEAIMGMAPWVLDDGIEINPKFRRQEDPIFLLYETGSVKAKAVGYSTGVHLFDAAIRDADLDLIRLSRDEKELVAQYENLVAQEKEYDGIEEEGKRIQESLATLRQIRDEQDLIVRAEQKLTTLRSLQAKRDATERLLSQLRQSVQAEDAARSLLREADIVTRAETLANQLAKAKRLEKQLSQMVSDLAAVKALRPIAEKVRETAEHLGTAFSRVSVLNALRANRDVTIARLDVLRPIADCLDVAQRVHHNVQELAKTEEVTSLLSVYRLRKQTAHLLLSRLLDATERADHVRLVLSGVKELVRAEDLVACLKRSREEARRLEDAVDQLRFLSESEPVVRKLKTSVASSQRATELVDRLTRLRLGKEKLVALIAQLHDAALMQAEVKRVHADIERLEKADSVMQRLRQLHNQLQLCNAELQSARDKLEQEQQNYRAMLDSMTVCPLCNRPMNMNGAVHQHNSYHPQATSTRRKSNLATQAMDQETLFSL